MALLLLPMLLLPAAAASGLGLSCVVTTDCHCPSDGVTKATACLRQCLANCHAKSPAGAQVQVHFPAGRYLTGALNLSSNMVLQPDLPCDIRGGGGQSLVIGGSSLVTLEGREGQSLVIGGSSLVTLEGREGNPL